MLTHSPVMAGAESQMIALFRGVVRRGHDVRLLCSTEDYASRARAAGLRAEPLPLPLSSLAGIALAARQARIRCVEGAVEMLHAEGVRASLAAALAARTGARLKGLVATVHNIKNPRPWSYALATRLLRITGCYLTTVSDSERARYLANGFPATRCATVHNGVSPAPPSDPLRREALRRAMGIPTEGLVIAQVGRLSPEKGHGILFRALSRMPPGPPRPLLLLIGEGAERARLERLRDQLQLTDRVLFLGFREDVGELFSCVDLLVHPSLREAFPMALLEAMAAGVPIIASRVGGVPEMIRDGVEGWLVPPRDEEGLLRALLHACGDAEARAACGRAGVERARHAFSFEGMVSRTLEVYRVATRAREAGVA